MKTPFSVKYEPEHEGDRYPWAMVDAEGVAIFAYASEGDAQQSADHYNSRHFKGKHRKS